MVATATRGTLLVIGANRGIGYQLATRCRDKGYDVYGTYRPQSRDDPTVKQLKEQGIPTFEVDFLDEESIDMMARSFDDRTLDVLINCGGIYNDWGQKGFEEHSADDFLTHFRVNTLGPFLTSRALLPALTRSQSPSGAKIVNISSNMASVANNKAGGNACYRVSKTALNQLTKTMAVDLGRANSNVRTLAVHPGWLPTRMTDGYGEDNMETCVEQLIATVERLGSSSSSDGGGGGGGSTETSTTELESGSYVKWSGERLAD